jgi:hypothetical protein
MARLIFLDIDGVLRRVTSPTDCFDRDCLERFESAVRKCPVSKIVISSTWRFAMPLKELRSRFSPDIAARIVGVTPQIFEEETYERMAEIDAFLKEKNVTAVKWLAIDDNSDHFPAGSPVLITDPNKGFDEVSANQLSNILLGIAKS